MGCGSAGKESACNAGDTRDTGSVPGSGRSPGGFTPVFFPGVNSPGEGNGNSLQYSCQGNPMDRGVWSKESDTTEHTHKNPGYFRQHKTLLTGQISSRFFHGCD